MSRAEPRDLSQLEGEVLGQFLLEACLGSSLHAAVFRAHDRRLDRLVALKVLAGEEPDAFAQFRAEANLVKQLEHPNIVRLYDYGEEQGLFWMATELIQGEPLTAVLRREGALPPARALDITRQLVEGLVIAHAQQIVHCDLKPDNIMLTQLGVSSELVKLVDFGVSRALASTGKVVGGDVVGTPRYMAPEQLHAYEPTPETDVFAVGAILYEMLFGEPIRKGDLLEVLTQAVAGEIVYPGACPDPQLEPVLHKCLARFPADRYEDASELYGALQPLLERRAEAQPSRRMLLALAAGLGVALVALVGVVSWFAWPAGLERGSSLADATTRVGAPPVLPVERVTSNLVRGAVVSSATTSRVLGAPLGIAFPPIVDHEVMVEEMRPIERYLLRELRRPVRWLRFPDYQSVADAVAKGDVPFGVFPPTLYVRAEHQLPPGTLRVLAFEEFDGASMSDGYLLVNEKRGFIRLEQLRGARFCFTDRNSTTGYLMPVHFLRDQGLESDAFIGSVHWSGSHLQVIRDVLDGICDVAATYSGAYLSAYASGLPIGRLRILAITGRSPQNAVVAGPGANRDVADAVSKALLSFDPQKELGLERVGDSLLITGYQHPDPARLDDLRDIVASEADKLDAPALRAQQDGSEGSTRP